MSVHKKTAAGVTLSFQHDKISLYARVVGFARNEVGFIYADYILLIADKSVDLQGLMKIYNAGGHRLYLECSSAKLSAMTLNDDESEELNIHEYLVESR